MPFDPALADRVRRALAGSLATTEKKMFGGVAFMAGDAMLLGVDRSDLIVRCAKDETDELLERPGVRIFDLSGGRPMKGWLLVGPDATRTPEGLAHWVAFALARHASGTSSGKGKRRGAKKA